MDVFSVHQQLITEYGDFTRSSVPVRDGKVRETVDRSIASGEQWPDPYLSLNPAFASGGSIDELVVKEVLHPECARIFQDKDEAGNALRGVTLHRHQRDALESAKSGESYVLTTGTGSGKSLGYIVPIVDRVLRDRELRRGGGRPGIKAIIVYPMNALANSQEHELSKFVKRGYPVDRHPITFERYTGQEGLKEREGILKNPPDILLTNYMMLEYLLTRPDERDAIITAAQGLQFLVLDELHTYRGRQGADVAMLVRRLRDACESPGLQCIGTSATMVTAGTPDEQRAAVAAVATRLFGTEVRPQMIIGETLMRATAARKPERQELYDAVAGGDVPQDYHALAEHPLAIWVEQKFGLHELDSQPGRLVRRDPTTVSSAARDLAIDIGSIAEDERVSDDLSASADERVSRCREAIERVLQAGSRTLHPETGRPLFAFRLHQFLSKGDTVHVTLESEKGRHTTGRYQAFAPRRTSDTTDRPLFPLVFCRQCGHEYLAVSKVTQEDGTDVFLPLDRKAPSGDGTQHGYLFIDDVEPWPEQVGEMVAQRRIPEHWIDPQSPRDKPSVANTFRKYLPVLTAAMPDGTEVPRGTGGVEAAFIPMPFKLCLSCVTEWGQVRGSDFAKVVGLDAEGRSTAMSVISAAIVRALADQDVNDEARKLLVFVDNRQDASLQAGHFNDFVQVTRLRGALFEAVLDEPEGLYVDELARRVLGKLKVDFREYAANQDAQHTRRNPEAAFRDVVEHRLLIDLGRGWRISQPNLEQTGLLTIRYDGIGEHDPYNPHAVSGLAYTERDWSDAHAALRDAAPEVRLDIMRALLNQLRKNLAVYAESLTPDGFKRLQTRSDQYLQGSWALPPGSPMPPVSVVYPFTTPPGGARRSAVHITGRTRFGDYLRYRAGLRAGLKIDDADAIIGKVFQLLAREVFEPADKGGYQLNAGQIRWCRNKDGQALADNVDLTPGDSVSGLRVNEYFQNLYRTVGTSMAWLSAKEHTAQVPSEERRDREEKFREGRLKVMYSSPTMELGVDIKTLAAVGLRNVPPTPANYAQRSGRAGRANQPALITTYCSHGNPHDQYYFRRPAQMVSGKVAPPRLDLVNEDLLRSHVHALWLAETRASLGSKMQDILDAEGDDPPLTVRKSLKADLSDLDAVRRATIRARSVLKEFTADLKEAAWWHDRWVDDAVASAYRHFDSACDRWRTLYRAALAEREEQHRRWLAASASPRARDRAASARYAAEAQYKLLRNEESGPESGFSDFYTYRYFASEGFLPGYAFPRLPLSAFIPGTRGRGRGSYLQRPRFIAVSEFGPGALIYHEGSTYQVERIQIPVDQPGEVATSTAWICESCGYLHDEDDNADKCVNCRQPLGGTAKNNLMRLQSVFTIRRRAITSDEEERRRAGFRLLTTFRYANHGRRSGRADSQVLGVDGSVLADLSYGDAATVRVINLGRPKGPKNKKPDGFFLDLTTGRWLKESDDPDGSDSPVDDLPSIEDAQHRKRVIPYVQDSRNILVFRWAEPLDGDTAVTVQYALERGIEARYQLEDSELTSEKLPDGEDRGRILLTESAEGGAGVLRRLREEKDAVAEVAREALDIIHYRLDSDGRLIDLGQADHARERCEKGCYDCLLSYANQPYHRRIDRHKAAPLLAALVRGWTDRGGSGTTHSEHLGSLLEKTSDLRAASFLSWLDGNGYRLPTHAGHYVPEAQARPDFVYLTADVQCAVFLENTAVHGDSAERDEAAEDRLWETGWNVIRLPVNERDWQQAMNRLPSVFGAGDRR